ncbi:P-loop containing nucleoside triphosphate hydrolase protein [Obelidium mucronatum]|nr:P-loop containing nucleoside triphosphate hydrolase protein [Obelidium mucronatum]
MSGFLVSDERPTSTPSTATVEIASVSESSTVGLMLSWKDLGYSVKDKSILAGLSGSVAPGQVLAVMGPSGAGKSTFLDVIAGRKGNAGTMHGKVMLNGTERPMKKYSSYVTQDDSLIGCFTVRETVRWAVELNLPTYGKKEREEKVNELLAQFGLMKCADHVVGDAILRGISGGEKRRLSIAIQLVKEPKVIFLDEPTSGLDSAASFKVMEAIKDLAKRRNCTVVCSIHQPSPSTYSLFDKVLFLARGNTVYFGENKDIEAEYFKSVGYEIPLHMNVPDAVLDHINVDFLGDEKLADTRINHFVESWDKSENRTQVISQVDLEVTKGSTPSTTDAGMVIGGGDYTHNFFKQVEILTRRNFANAIKNILLFWVRLAMYLAMAILMGTTWWRMSLNQNTVQDRFSAIFFAIAFLAFMSVAGIPAILEERAVFYRERMNRTYRVGAYVVANTLVSLPFVFLIAIGFSLPAYWMMGMNPGASNFFTFVAYLWLALYVAESMVILLAAIFPIFVAALTLASFFNGLEMVTQGYFVRRQNIPAFWRYGFHYWNYQKWSWEALIANEFVGLTFDCNPNPSGKAGCFCSIPSSLGPDACTFSGEDIIAEYGYTDYSYWKSAVCLVALIVFFRLAFYVTLRVKKPKV